MCKNCNQKFDLVKTQILANKILNLLNENIVIYQNSLGYNIISEKCYSVNLGKLIEIIKYE